MDRVKKQLGCTENIQYSIATEEICVAVLDTGIGNHPDFEDRVVAFRDFVNGRQERYDDSGHGTHVAGCIGGSGRLSNGRFSGIAPTCRLCVGKVLDERGEGSIESMYHGLLWVLENRLRYRIRVLNISVGIGEDGDKERVEELSGLLERVCEQGVVVVCAAGNKGPGEGTLSPLGTSRRVITVGCHEGGYFGNRRDLCENYSGRGWDALAYRKPDLVAPGTDIVSCNGNLRRDRRGGYREPYVKKSGTSMATPVVTGIMALWLQADPTLTIDDVKEILKETALNDEFTQASPHRFGCGKVDALAGIKKVLGIGAGVNDVIAESEILVSETGTNQFNIFVPSAQAISARLYSMSGAQVAAIDAQANDATLDASALPAGVYLLSVKAGSASRTLKIAIR